jgi:hypothetical protein
LREITDGIQAGERVIVNGLQSVQPGSKAEAKLVDMPSSTASNAKETARPNVVINP